MPGICLMNAHEMQDSEDSSNCESSPSKEGVLLLILNRLEPLRALAPPHKPLGKPILL
ncbi:hypothetical protein CTA2_10921 [Colletotrichum tanaceti]|nr:hypothetical protein CTA2_10921 [Colletotrichum tanaceti]